MPNGKYHFDADYYKNKFDNMFGSGSYDSGIQRARQIGQSNAQVDLAKKAYNARFQSPGVTKKSYSDAVDYVRNNKEQFQKDGAYRVANEIRNDPIKQQEIKDQGYNVSDYINALYAGLSDGKFRSEREYNQYVGKLKKDRKENPYVSTYEPKEEKKDDSNLLKDFGKWYGAAWKSVGQSLNPFDDVTAAEAWVNKDKALKGNEVNRFVNRAVDSTVLNSISNAENKVGLNPDWAKSRKFGKGGATDFISEGIGYLVPGTGALKGAKLLKAGLGAEKGLKALGAGSKLAKLGGLGAEGATSGLAFGTAREGLQEAINPNAANLKQHLTNIGLDTGLGLVGDPLFHVGGSSLGKFLGKAKASRKELDSVVSNLELPKDLRAEALRVKDIDNGGQNPFNVLNKPLSSDVKTGYKSIPRTQSNFKTNVTKDDAYYNEYIDALDNQVALLKSQMGQGVNPGGLIRDESGEVVGRFSRTSNNPQWYQELYKELGKQPTNEDLYTLAAKQLKEGYMDNGIKIPAWEPKRAQDVSNEIEQMRNIDTPDKEGLNVAINQLQKSRKQLAQPHTDINIQSTPQPLGQLFERLNKPKERPLVENISAKEPGLHRLTKTEQSHMNNIDTFTANNADKTIPDTSGHIVSKKDVKPTLSTIKDKGIVKLIDNLKPLDWFDKAVEKATGKKLIPSESSYTLGLNSRGSDMISKQILTNNMVDSKGNVIGKSLKDVTQKLTPSKLKAFEDYLVNKHAITRMDRGEKVFPDDMKMSPQKAETKVKAYEEKYPEFKDLSQAYYNYNKKLGKAWLVDTGILSKEEWEGYLKVNPNYVPNNRIFKDIERHMNQSAKRGFANQANPIKKAVGSQRKIVSPIESTIEHTAQYVKTAKRNEVMQTLIKNIQKSPDAFEGWAHIVKTDKMPESVKETLEKEGIDGVLENINNGFEQKPDLTKGNIVTGIIDGQKVHVKIDDPQLLEALTNLTPRSQNAIIGAIGQVTRVMKNLTTGINPVFSLTRNIFRDIPQSYINSNTTNNPIKFAKDLVGAFVDVVGNRKAYQSFKNFGGGHSSPISSDVNLLAQSKRSILPQNKLSPRYVGGKLLGGLENLNNAIESTPRLAEFKRASKGGSYDSKVRGLFEANDITTNFNKFGNVTKDADAIIPYLNAAVQGLDKLARQTINNPVKTGVKAFAAITVPSILLYQVNHKNPNYKQLSNYIKDQNFLIPLDDGTFIKIPKPREFGVMFGSDVERLLRSWEDSDPHAFDDFMNTIVETFKPPLRTIAHPALVDTVANKNFMGAPIVPGDLENLSPQYQYDSRTSEVAKKIGAALNMSPKNIDYLIKSYGGVIGELGIPATTKNTTVGETLKRKVTSDPVFSNDILNRFYDTKNKLDRAHSDYTKQGETTKYLNEELRKVFDARGRDISDLRKRLKQALNNDSLTKKQREKQVRNLQVQINNVAKQTNQLVR